MIIIQKLLKLEYNLKNYAKFFIVNFINIK